MANSHPGGKSVLGYERNAKKKGTLKKSIVKPKLQSKDHPKWAKEMMKEIDTLLRRMEMLERSLPEVIPLMEQTKSSLNFESLSSSETPYKKLPDDLEVLEKALLVKKMMMMEKYNARLRKEMDLILRGISHWGELSPTVKRVFHSLLKLVVEKAENVNRKKGQTENKADILTNLPGAPILMEHSIAILKNSSSNFNANRPPSMAYSFENLTEYINNTSEAPKDNSVEVVEIN